jgi:RHS repeat-associated protein
VLVTNTYDLADEPITSTTTIGSSQPLTTTYTYDANGNQIIASGPSFATVSTYNEQNQLVQVQGPNTDLQLVYDGQGDRLRSYEQQVAGTPVIVNDTQDPVGGLSDLASDGTQDYLYAQPGSGQAPLMGYNPTTTHATYLAIDTLGSVRLATNSTNAVIGAGAYDAWGNAQPSSGATLLAGLQASSPFGYAGQQYDAGPGTYAMRARTYNPTTGQFESEDPQAYDPQVPITLNPYAYAGDVPDLTTDPSGLWRVPSAPNSPSRSAFLPNHDGTKENSPAILMGWKRPCREETDHAMVRRPGLTPRGWRHPPPCRFWWRVAIPSQIRGHQDNLLDRGAHGERDGEQNGRRHVLGLQDPRPYFGRWRVRSLVQNVGCGIAERDHAAANAMFPLLDIDHVAQLQQSSLGCRVGGACQGTGSARGAGSHVHKRAASMRAHAGQDRLRAQETAIQVGMDDALPVIPADVRDGAPRHIEAGVVHQNIDLPGDRVCHAGEAGHIFRIGDVGLHHHRPRGLRALGLDTARSLFQRLKATSSEHHGSALSRQRQRRGASYPGAGARDDSDLSVQSLHDDPPSVAWRGQAGAPAGTASTPVPEHAGSSYEFSATSGPAILDAGGLILYTA